MKDAPAKELLLQALETERGGASDAAEAKQARNEMP